MTMVVEVEWTTTTLAASQKVPSMAHTHGDFCASPKVWFGESHYEIHKIVDL
jgi:hypothetical protein